LRINESNLGTAFYFACGNLLDDLYTGSDGVVSNMVLVGDANKILSGSTHSLVLGGEIKRKINIKTNEL
jgi:hypothetical protein